MNKPQNPLSKAAPQVELLPPSISLRVGNRRLTMSWRPRKRPSSLLSGLLYRSWRAMLGTSLRISATAAAVCLAWNAQALAAAPAPNTLPTGFSVTYGDATYTVNGNLFTINQTSGKAIANFDTFSIGANAVVNISQPSAAAAFLARVTGSDPSLIYGLLKSNGSVALINQNGILVGPTGVVDVARFIASTLNVNDSDFLAGRLHFSGGGIAGNVENQGTIKTASGGSVYLIGANVDNNGVITSPNGEILLAAGQTVQLIDTGTPGVTVNVTGATGKVTNLGAITAEAGRIGIAAGLISNSGDINASSVVNDGGRIFLRASQNLTTTVASKVTADGAGKGGSVVLYSEKSAHLDGDISATGAAGRGGFIETSGKQSLDVVKMPTVGSGGEWYIDPYNLEVVVETANNIIPDGGNPNIITSNGSSSFISASTINTLLNGNTNVTLATGNGGAASGGNITVSADITKSGGTEAVLTLNADNNIVVNANITSTSDKLGLNLNTNANGVTTGVHSAQLNGKIALNGGTLNVSDGVGGNANGNLTISNGGLLDLASSLMNEGLPVGGTVNTGNLTVNTGGTLAAASGATVNANGMFRNNGTVNLQNSQLTASSFTNSGTLTAANSSVLNTDTFINNNGASVVVNASTLNATASFNNMGTLTANNGATLNIGDMTTAAGASTTLNVAVLNAGAVSNAGTMSLVDSSATVTAGIANAGVFTLSNGTINTVSGFNNQVTGTLNLLTQAGFNNGAVSNLGTLNISGVNIKFENGMTNGGTMNVTGSVIANGTMANAATGTMNLGSAGNSASLSGSGAWINDGYLAVTGAGNSVSIAAGLTNNQSGTVAVSGSGSSLAGGDIVNAGSFTVGPGASSSGNAFSNIGTTTLNGASMSFNAFTNGVGGKLYGTGSITVGTLVNNGTLAPGGDGVVGTLAINGNYEQQSAGKLLIDVASADSYDRLTYSGESIALDGTLQTKWLGSSTPVLTLDFAPIASAGASTSSGVFRHVYGDIFTIDGGLQMIKPFYNKGGQGVKLGLRGSETIFLNEGYSSWGDAGAWSTGYFPTAIDNILVGSAAQLSHGYTDGIDTVSRITLSDGASLSVSGGTVNVGSIVSTGRSSLMVSGEGGGGEGGGGEAYGINNFVATDPTPYVGILNISGSARVSNLTLSGIGAINGGVGSTLSVTDSFSQSSGSVISSGGAVSLSQAADNLVVGNITARNLVLEAQNGAITQTAALHVKQQLLTSSVTGTTLDAAANSIAAFAANNRGMGNIVLVNNLATADTNAVRINGVTNANGSINISNTGAMATTTLGTGADFLTTLPTAPDLDPIPTLADRLTTLGIATGGAVRATGPAASVSLAAHSPLTIGSGGVTSSGGITLSAGAPDNLVINGAITSTGGGTISLASGGSIFVNANIFTQGLYTPAPAPVYAPGVSVTDINGTTITIAQAVQKIISPIIAQNVAPASNSVVTSVSTTQAVNNPVMPLAPPTAGTNPVSLANTMTTGGDPGTFGGSEAPEQSVPTQKSGVTAKAKTSKMFCN